MILDEKEMVSRFLKQVYSVTLISFQVATFAPLEACHQSYNFGT